MDNVSVNLNKTIGKIKPMHTVGQPPIKGGFMTLEDAIGYKPDFAVNDYAVRLSDTELGKYYEELGLLDPDTYLCIRTPGAIQEMTGKGKTSDKFKEAAATVKAIIEFKAPEDNA